MASRAERYPLDFDALKRGDYISHQRLQDISGLEAGTEDYSLYVLNLSEQIGDALSAKFGGYVTAVRRDYGIAILTPPEQDAHTQRRWQRHGRGLRRALLEDVGNDETQLGSDERERRDRRLLVTSWQLQQLMKRPPKELLE